jgi:hypothetical protein
VCWTAHRFKTSRGTYTDVDNLLQAAPEYSRQILRVNRSHGEEGFYLKNGASLEFLARENAGSGRGLGGKRNVFDEALILSGALVGSLLPTLSAQPMAHVNYASSAALLADPSNHLRELTRRGRYAVQPDRFIHLEYCAPGGWGTNPCDLGDDCPHDGRLGCRFPMCAMGLDCPHTLTAPDCALDNLDYVRAANHSLGRLRSTGTGIAVQYVLDERVAMAAIPREYGRERLGWDEDPPLLGGANGIDMEQFSRLENKTLMAPRSDDQVAIVVDMPPDRTEVNIGVAWVATDPVTQQSKPAVIVHTLAGTDTVLDYLAGKPGDDDDGGLAGKADLLELAIQAGGPAGSLIKPLDARGREAWPSWQVKALTAQEVAQAVGYWRDSIRNGTFWHLGQETLQKAQASATLRKYGDALMWARDDLSNISAVYAATLALHRLFTEGDQGGPNVW